MEISCSQKSKKHKIFSSFNYFFIFVFLTKNFNYENAKNYFSGGGGHFLSLLFVIILTSCQHDDIIKNIKGSNEVNTTNNIDGHPSRISLIEAEGRLYFPNGEEFSNALYNFTDKSLTELYDFMRPFYSQGFYSLRPPAVKGYHEESIIQQYQNRINQFKATSNIHQYTDDEIYQRIDETSYIVISPTIAALLNADGEVQIGNAILKFTDAGVFIVELNSYSSLINYLNQNEISDNLLNPTDPGIIDNFRQRHAPGTPVDPEGKIYFHYPPAIPAGPGGENGPTGGSGPWGDDESGPLEGLDEFVGNLTPCNSRNSLIGQIFGTHKVCEDRYGRDRRVKTEVYNYHVDINLILQLEFYSIGVKVRHQDRDFPGIWWNHDADVVAAGVEMLQVKYDYSSLLSPDLYALNTQGVKYSYKPANISYALNTNIWNYGNPTYTIDFTLSYPDYPEFIQDGLVIEGIGNPFIDNLIAQGNEALTSEELNDLFWGSVYDIATSHMNSLNPNYVNPHDIAMISNYPNQGVLYTQNTNFEYCTNCKKQNENFGFDTALGVTIKYNPSNGRFDYDSGAPGAVLVNPEDMKIRMFGAAKVNGVWHGSLLIYGY